MEILSSTKYTYFKKKGEKNWGKKVGSVHSSLKEEDRFFQAKKKIREAEKSHLDAFKKGGEAEMGRILTLGPGERESKLQPSF